MKNINYTLVLLFSMLIFIACDDNDTEGTIYEGANNEASFPGKSSSYTFGDEDPTQFEVIVQRNIIDGAASVPVTADDPSGFFTVPQAVEFADGAYESKIVISFDRSKLTAGVPYPIKLTVPANPIVEKTITHTVSITRDYTWQPFATGTYASTFQNSSWEQVIEKAEGVERYKLVSLYADGYDLVFDAAPDGSIIIIDAEEGEYLGEDGALFVTGYMHSRYGIVSCDIDLNPDYSYFDLTNKEFYMDGYFHVSAGAFGWYTETFTW